jgi:hypothetical protein
MKIGLGILMTLIALFISFSYVIEAPPELAESIAIKYVALFNLVWMAPYSIKYIRQKNYKELRNCFITYVLIYVAFFYFVVYSPKFDDKKWRNEIDNATGYGNSKAHTNGKMVPDIIKSKILIGLSKVQVIEKLGKIYFTLDVYSEDNICYYYTGSKFFDGCNKLVLKFKNEIFTEASYGGCD